MKNKIIYPTVKVNIKTIDLLKPSKSCSQLETITHNPKDHRQ